MRRRCFFPATLILALSLGTPLAAAAPEFTVLNGVEPVTLDPALVRDEPGLRLVRALFEGLVVLDAKGEVKPGLAESWKTADGRTYTFRLRKTTWSDGTVLTAQTVVDSWRRQADPATNAPVDGLPEQLVVGAAAFRSGQAGPEAVAVRAVDDATLQVVFTAPLATLAALADPSFSVVPTHALEQFRAPPTTAFVGNGPYQLESWTSQTKATVVPNARYWDPKSAKLARIHFLVSPDPYVAFGQYTKGGADWLPRLAIDLLADASRRKDYQSALFWGTYYYAFNVTNPAVSDARVRRALSLALDRGELARKVLRAGQRATTTLIPSTTASPADPKAARRLLSDAGFPGGKGLSLVLLFPAAAVGEQALAEAVQAQWQTELGVEVTLMAKESDAWSADLASHNFVVARVGWWGDLPDPANFLEPWTSTANPASGYSNAKFDALVARAHSLTDGSERSKVVKEAEALLLADAPLIPLFTYASNQLIDLTKWDGWATNVFDVHTWKNLGPKK